MIRAMAKLPADSSCFYWVPGKCQVYLPLFHFCNPSLNTVCSTQSRNCCQHADHDPGIQSGLLVSTQARSQAGDRERWETFGNPGASTFQESPIKRGKDEGKGKGGGAMAKLAPGLICCMHAISENQEPPSCTVQGHAQVVWNGVGTVLREMVASFRQFL